MGTQVRLQARSPVMPRRLAAAGARRIITAAGSRGIVQPEGAFHDTVLVQSMRQLLRHLSSSCRCLLTGHATKLSRRGFSALTYFGHQRYKMRKWQGHLAA